MKLNSKQYQELEGLYFWCKIAPKVRAEQGELGEKEITEQFKLYATELDKLGVSWKLQNQVAYAATIPANKDRYFRNVLKEILN